MTGLINYIPRQTVPKPAALSDMLEGYHTVIFIY